MAASGNPPPTYVIDSSSWGLIKEHAARTQIQGCIFELIDGDRIRVPPAVKTELEKSDHIDPWLSPRYDEIVDTRVDQDEGFLRLVGRVTAAFPGMSGIRSRKTKADPWVIAYAMHANDAAQANYCVVVCDETINRRPNRKMPTDCRKFGVEPISLFEMLRREFPYDGW